MDCSRGWTLGDSARIWALFDSWHVLVKCLLGGLLGVGAYLLEVSKALKIER